MVRNYNLAFATWNKTCFKHCFMKKWVSSIFPWFLAEFVLSIIQYWYLKNMVPTGYLRFCKWIKSTCNIITSKKRSIFLFFYNCVDFKLYLQFWRAAALLRFQAIICERKLSIVNVNLMLIYISATNCFIDLYMYIYLS